VVLELVVVVVMEVVVVLELVVEVVEVVVLTTAHYRLTDSLLYSSTALPAIGRFCGAIRGGSQMRTSDFSFRQNTSEAASRGL